MIRVLRIVLCGIRVVSCKPATRVADCNINITICHVLLGTYNTTDSLRVPQSAFLLNIKREKKKNNTRELRISFAPKTHDFTVDTHHRFAI
jgi:hypothetical protein